jgi:branched-chain amino acid transport system permease protein
MSLKKFCFLLLALVGFFAVQHFLPEHLLYQVCLIAATALIVLGLVVVSGVAGQISLAQAAFVALGGYGAGILGTRYGVPLYLGIPVAGLLAGLIGFVLGQVTLRVSGHYLALATMAFTAIVQLALINLEDLTGGAAGMPMPSFSIAGHTLASGAQLYFVIVPTFIFFFVLVRHVIGSNIGRAYSAIRQSETAAAAMGINVLRYKAFAFAASGVLGAVGGGLLAALSTYLDPSQFGITQTVYYLAIAVVGGMAAPAGAVVGSIIFVFLPELLQAFQTYLGLVFALLLLLFILVRPTGLAFLFEKNFAGFSALKNLFRSANK